MARAPRECVGSMGGTASMFVVERTFTCRASSSVTMRHGEPPSGGRKKHDVRLIVLVLCCVRCTGSCTGLAFVRNVIIDAELASCWGPRVRQQPFACAEFTDGRAAVKVGASIERFPWLRDYQRASSVA